LCANSRLFYLLSLAWPSRGRAQSQLCCLCFLLTPRLWLAASPSQQAACNHGSVETPQNTGGGEGGGRSSIVFRKSSSVILSIRLRRLRLQFSASAFRTCRFGQCPVDCTSIRVVVEELAVLLLASLPLNWNGSAFKLHWPDGLDRGISHAALGV
jgi:hypothetical protein